MSSYKHGVYGEIMAVSDKVAAESKNAIVYIGTAPVHNIAGGAGNLNKPVVVNSFSEAVKLFGYNDDWASYSLCEAMFVHLILRGVGPLVLINTLSVSDCQDAEASTALLTPSNGRVIIASAASIVLDSVTITGKTKGTDYTIAYDYTSQKITIKETSDGSLGTTELTITYNTVDPSVVTSEDVIGASDNEGTNTGIYAIRNVYQDTGYIPSLMLCPGFSEIPAVHAAMLENSKKVNGHWDVFLYADLPIINGEADLKMSEAAGWKATNGYTAENEKPFYPIILGTDTRKYHISVLAAANFQKLTSEQDGIPYKSSSNTECKIIQSLYFGESNTSLRFDDSLINELLNKNGIASAAYVGGRWVIWGAHTGEYDESDADSINVSETNMMMMFYISNDFQHRRASEIDTPMTMNRLKQIVAEEQTRLDALVSTGALLYGACYLNATADSQSDMANGDFSFKFNVTTTPLCKSMTALVNWTDDGFETYFVDEEDE